MNDQDTNILLIELESLAAAHRASEQKCRQRAELLLFYANRHAVLAKQLEAMRGTVPPMAIDDDHYDLFTFLTDAFTPIIQQADVDGCRSQSVPLNDENPF